MSSERDNFRLTALTILNQGKLGTLSTIDYETGAPFGSLVNYGQAEQGFPTLLISGLARHTRCLKADSRTSLLVVGTLPSSGDPLTACRLTITGKASIVRDESIASRYIERHPYSEMYAGFGDFAFWRIQPEKIYVIAGFGNIFSYEAQEFFAKS
jgi:heme iron utilization protein